MMKGTLLLLLLLLALPSSASGQGIAIVMPRGSLTDQDARLASRFHYVPTDRVLHWLAGDTLLVTHSDLYGGATASFVNCEGSGFFKVPLMGGRPVRVGEPFCQLDRNITAAPDGSAVLFFGDPDYVRKGPSVVMADAPLLRLSLVSFATDTLKTGCGSGAKEVALSSTGRLAWSGRCWDRADIGREPNCRSLDDPRPAGCDPENRNGVYVSQLRGGETRRAGGPEDVDAHDPTWSPDGESVAFSVGSNPNQGRWELAGVEPGLLMIADGSGARSLDTKGEVPSWSPDGAWIAFFGDDRDDPNPRYAGPRIYLIPPDGTNRHRIFLNDAEATYPDWFWGGWPLIEREGKVFGPLVWSPDSRWLAFSRQAEDGASIWRVEISTGRLERVTIPGE